MSQAEVIYLSITLVILVLCSAFFSGSETSLMAINRYRLRHLVRSGKHVSAERALELLKRPDRLLGMILIGNTFVNILASSIGTVLAIHFFGEYGVLVSATVLTFVVLIFGEVTPKTLAALHPDKVAFWVVWPIGWLLKVLYPVVVLVNAIGNGCIRLLGMGQPPEGSDHLTLEELRTVVAEQGKWIPPRNKTMLLRLIDLNEMNVDDIMVPRNEIFGIDMEDSWENILDQLNESQYTRLPLYQDTIDNVLGFLHMRDVLALMAENKGNKEALQGIASEAYYIPEGTPLMTQLLNFQKHKRRIGLVVDEYGDIQGLVTLEDILEEVVGEFTTDIASESEDVHVQPDGSYIVEGWSSVRDLNRTMHWHLPTDGPKTLSGVIVEYLEAIPAAGTGVRIAGYPMEILEIRDNKIKTVKIMPQLAP